LKSDVGFASRTTVREFRQLDITTSVLVKTPALLLVPAPPALAAGLARGGRGWSISGPGRAAFQPDVHAGKVTGTAPVLAKWDGWVSPL